MDEKIQERIRKYENGGFWECPFMKMGNIDHRFRMLDAADQDGEAGLLSEAYERLIAAYQEARELNDEMEELLKNALMN